MNEVDHIIRKFRDSPSPVVMTPAEHRAFCSYYGAVKSNDYANPFMGKVIEVREPEWKMPNPDELLEEEYEAPVEERPAPEEEEKHFVPPLVEGLDTSFPEEEEGEQDEDDITEDPFA